MVKVTRTVKRVYEEIVEGLRRFCDGEEEYYGDQILDNLEWDLQEYFLPNIGYEEICDSLRVYDKCDEFWDKLLEKLEIEVEVRLKPKLSFNDFISVLKEVRNE